jgi:TetR/AcrR family transcriptional regulator, ethionamide resistance regulator
MREDRRAAAEERIVHAARELLHEGEPFADLSIEQIASRAGISRPAFYGYYRDKRELLIRLIADSAAPVFREADELVGGRPSGPTEIPFTINAAMAWARGSPEIYCAGIEASAYDEVVGRYWREELLDRFTEVIERRIRSQRAKGEALPINPGAAARSLVLMVMYTVYDQVRHERATTDKQLVETLTTIAVRTVYGPVDAAAQKQR